MQCNNLVMSGLARMVWEVNGVVVAKYVVDLEACFGGEAEEVCPDRETPLARLVRWLWPRGGTHGDRGARGGTGP